MAASPPNAPTPASPDRRFRGYLLDGTTPKIKPAPNSPQTGAKAGREPARDATPNAQSSKSKLRGRALHHTEVPRKGLNRWPLDAQVLGDYAERSVLIPSGAALTHATGRVRRERHGSRRSSTTKAAQLRTFRASCGHRPASPRARGPQTRGARARTAPAPREITDVADLGTVAKRSRETAPTSANQVQDGILTWSDRPRNPPARRGCTGRSLSPHIPPVM